MPPITSMGTQELARTCKKFGAQRLSQSVFKFACKCENDCQRAMIELHAFNQTRIIVSEYRNALDCFAFKTTPFPFQERSASQLRLTGKGNGLVNGCTRLKKRTNCRRAVHRRVGDRCHQDRIAYKGGSECL